MRFQCQGGTEEVNHKSTKTQTSFMKPIVYSCLCGRFTVVRLGGSLGRRGGDRALSCRSVAMASGVCHRLPTFETDICQPADHRSSMTTRSQVSLDLPIGSFRVSAHPQTTSSVCFLPVSRLRSSSAA